jgi:hypothetical protein
MSTEKPKKQIAFEYAADTRKFEIDLFWRRSLFFWGFIAAAFVAYAAAVNADHRDNDLVLAISSFGIICSVAWTLANRGSKFWQNAWEAKLETLEDDVLGTSLFKAKYTPRKSELHYWGPWSKTSHFSVSRLAIALSDFTLGVWIVLGCKAIPGIKWPPCINGAFWIPTITAFYAIAMLYFGRSSKDDES